MRDFRIFSIAFMLQVFIATSVSANQLQNSGFEDNPPPNPWNNVGWSIAPWVIVNGPPSNVVKVNQGASSQPNNEAPWSDASNSPVGTVRHYLDIVGRNNFYQTFKSKCSGKATFGGFFSTRANRPGQARVTLRRGDINGQILGTSNPVNLPGGQSSTDPWTKVDYTAAVVAGNVYTLEIGMDNNMNFDEGFVNIPDCPPIEPIKPACAPFNGARLASLLEMTPGNPLSNPYLLKVNPNLDPSLNTDMQAYIDLHANNGHGANSLVVLTQVFDLADNKQAEGYHCWTKGIPSNPACKKFPPATSFYNLLPGGFQEGETYKLKTFIFLEGAGTGWVTDYIPPKCDRGNPLEFNWTFR